MRMICGGIWRNHESPPLPLVGEGLGERGSISLLENAKNLRQQMTDAEKILWRELRAHRFQGVKFKRQKPIGTYIVDFVSPLHKLVIELDGGQHAQSSAYDEKRDGFLRAQGYTVLRFWNNEFLTQRAAVLQVIYEHLFPAHPLP